MRPALAISAATGLVVWVMLLLTIAPAAALRSDWRAEVPFGAADAAWISVVSPQVGGPDGTTPSGALLAAWRALSGGNVNILSSLLVATAAAAVAFVAVRVAGPWAGLGASFAFALSPGVWVMGIAAEGDLRPVLDAALALTALALVKEWSATPRPALLAAASGMLAALVADDLTAALLVVPFAWIVATRLRDHVWHVGIAALVLVAVAVSLQWYEVHRLLAALPASATPTTVSEAIRGMWFRGTLPAGDLLSAAWTRTHAVAMAAVKDAGVLATALGVIGAAVLARGVAARMLMGAAAAVIVMGPLPGTWSPSIRLPLALGLWWVAVAYGLRTLRSWPTTDGGAVAAVLVVALPLMQGLRTCADSRLLVDHASAPALQAIVARLPGGAAVVSERVRLSRVLQWIAGTPRGARAIEVVHHDAPHIASLVAGGRAVFATERAAARLSLLGFRSQLLAIPGRDVDDVTASTPRHAVFAVGATPGAFSGSPHMWRATRRALGIDESDAPRGAFGALAQPAYELDLTAFGQRDIDLRAAPDVPRGLAPAYLPPGGIRVVVGASGATAALNGREVAHADDGLVLSTWHPDTGEWQGEAFERANGWRTTWRVPGLEIARLAGYEACKDVRERWMDVSRHARSGRVGVQLTGAQAIRFYAARDRALTFRAASLDDRISPTLHTLVWDLTRPADALAADAALVADGVDTSSIPAGTRYVWRLDLASRASRPTLIALGLGGPPSWLRARSTGDDAGTAVCLGPAGTRVFAPGTSSREAGISLHDREAFGAGWAPVDRASGPHSRRFTASEAELFVHAGRSGPVEIGVEASLAAAVEQDPPSVTLVLDGTRMATHTLSSGRGSYRWSLPGHLWGEGLHRVVLRVTGLPEPAADRPLPLSVLSILLRSKDAGRTGDSSHPTVARVAGAVPRAGVRPPRTAPRPSDPLRRLSWGTQSRREWTARRPAAR